MVSPLEEIYNKVTTNGSTNGTNTEPTKGTNTEPTNGTNTEPTNGTNTEPTNGSNTIEGFINMNIFGLKINRSCLILMIIYTLIIMYKEDIMKTQFVKNLLK